MLEANTWINKMQNMYKFKKVDQDETVTLKKEQLNFKQRIAYDLIEEWVNSKTSPDGTDVNPFYLNLSGRAGCGKSAVLKCVSKYIRSKANPNFLKIGAPTGTAAFLVKGNTLHSLFNLPINKGKGVIKELSGDPLRDLQESFKGTELIVIDEKSMIGQYTFYMIDARLRQAKPEKGNEPFGGVSIILMGDFAQLSPVRDQPLFMQPDENNNKSKCSTNPQVLSGYHLFMNHFSGNSLIFDEVMRQGPDQKEFKECLDRLANGKLTLDDWEYLRKRGLNESNFTRDEIAEIKAKSVKICALNKDTGSHNKERIKALGTPIAPCKSLNKGKGASSAGANEAGGLLQDISLAKGCKVILTKNLWTEAGLTNGAVGTVRYLIYDKDLPPAPPKFVICHFDEYEGPSYLGDKEEKCVPILPHEHHFYKQKESCLRQMIPLKPGYAISIHGSQGGTMDNVIVNLGNREFAAGLTYVAPTRVRKIENLYFDPMPSLSRLRSMAKTKVFAERRKQDEREKASDAKYVAEANKKYENADNAD